MLLGPGLIAQGGKDSLIRLLSLDNIAGANSHVGNESQMVSTPSQNMLFTAPAVLQNRAGTWMFAADTGGTAAWTLNAGQLTLLWRNSTPGTSPVSAGGLLYVYNPNGGLYIYDPQSGTQAGTLACGSGHWNSPIVVDGRIALPEGNSNQHAAAGTLDIWSSSGAH